MGRLANDCELVAVESYPPLLLRSARAHAMSKLRSSETLAKASRILATRSSELRGAVLELVEQLGPAMRERDWPAVFAATHEIRGLAGTAGLTATGRIANGLCHYLDAVTQLGLVPDATVAELHVTAITRSARTEDDTARHGDRVAQELSVLVAHKLAEIKETARD